MAVLGLRRGHLGRPLAVAAWVFLVVASLGAARYMFDAFGLRPGANEFNITAWEVRTFPNKWLYLAGQAFHKDRSTAQEDRDLQSFFAAVAAVDRAEQETGPQSRADLERAISTRDRLENRAEATIEGRITEAAKELGLTRSFGPLRMVWPPVDLEFTTPPRTLAVSPRDRIELERTTLLQAGLDLPQVENIERQAEARGDVSALAVPTAGVGAYPTIVAYASDYRDAVELAAHEWTHNYLAFRPLGFHYYKDNDLRTMNETVADIVGKEIADAVVARWPLETPPGGTRPPDKASTPKVDVRAELVKLRGEVDTLLAQGKVSEAESLMEERRQYLAANGYYIRRLNQAYFAFYNLYAGEAGSPAAVNPIGPKLDELRRRSGSLAEFVRIAGGLTSVADLDAALARLGG
jgi:hypothetical protein